MDNERLVYKAEKRHISYDPQYLFSKDILKKDEVPNLSKLSSNVFATAAPTIVLLEMLGVLKSCLVPL